VSASVKRVNLALQGGGSHGAYSWGALDALLEDERIEIVGVSGASSGAMNAVVFAAGLKHFRKIFAAPAEPNYFSQAVDSHSSDKRRWEMEGKIRGAKRKMHPAPSQPNSPMPWPIQQVGPKHLTNIGHDFRRTRRM